MGDKSIGRAAIEKIELAWQADPNSLEAEISGGNQLIMNYEQAQELFGIKFRRWLGIFNL